MTYILEQLRKICGEKNVLADEPMSRHTTFRVGGRASAYVLPENDEQIADVIKLCKSSGVLYCVIGNGSNVIVSDSGFDGVVISIFKNHSNILIKGNVIVAEAGALLATVGMQALAHELTGFEFATGIPGCVGGAVAMNAGAYGGEIRDCIVSATVLDSEGCIVTLTKDELKLSYRNSIVIEKGYTVLSAIFELQKGDKDKISAKLKELSEARRSKQPLEFPSAGSTFKRPEGHFAGKLIEDAGLKGLSVGGMQVSEKHAGFVVNTGKGTAEDFIKLTDEVKKTVMESSGIELELEVRLLGF